MNSNANGLEIAVIAMACRYPGADNIGEFWQNLVAGKETITDTKLNDNNSQQKFVTAAGILKDIDKFDPYFFDYTPREAELIDPQIRMYLELCWSALEEAGYSNRTQEKIIGMFAATRNSDYYLHHLQHNPINNSVNSWQIDMFNAPFTLATSIAYQLNLRGPAITLQTACSGSLIAIHQACRSILCGDCDMALAGGVSLFLPQQQVRPYQEGMILSLDGHCKAFSAEADGTVCSSGAGVVLLKRLEDAVLDKDNILAVIRGSAVNNDGNRKIGYTAPSVAGQSAVIRAALQMAEVSAEDIDYIEAHGTATKLGDPIEIEALTEGFASQQKQYCAIGSVKSNIGHTDAAAGVAGFIKTVLALKHKIIPAHLHFNKPNPAIDFSNTPFYVNQYERPWESHDKPRFAGVSSFGIGGSNAHIILMDADKHKTNVTKNSNNYQLICLSAKSIESLEVNSNNLSTFLKDNPEINLADIAYTMQTSRKHFDYKKIIVTNSIDSASKELNDPNSVNILSGKAVTQSQSIVFMFPGQGSQYSNMGKDLYERYPEYKYWFDYCCAGILAIEDVDLKKLVFSDELTTQDKLKDTYYAQLVLFSLEFSLAKLWLSFGVIPQAVIGHSLGEYVAACLAGVFSIDDALKIICVRARLVQKTTEGSMIAVLLPQSEIISYLNNELSIAAINTDDTCVVSGTVNAIENLKTQLIQRNISYTDLYTKQAFHSALIEPILEEFQNAIAQIDFHAPTIPFVSCVTGDWVDMTEIVTPEYWTKHLRETVLFAKGFTTLLENGYKNFIEVGAGQQLSKFAKSLSKQSTLEITTSLPSHKENKTVSSDQYFQTTLGKLWLRGIPIHFQKGHLYDRKKIALPTYAFNKNRYWIDAHTNHQLTYEDKQTVKDISDWFYTPIWKQDPLLKKQVHAKNNCYLILYEPSTVADDFIKYLKQQESVIIKVQVGSRFQESEADSFMVDATSLLDYQQLFNRLKLQNKLPNGIINLWPLQSTAVKQPHQIFLNTLYLVQAFTEVFPSAQLLLSIISKPINRITGNEKLTVDYSVLSGLTRVVQQEYPQIKCKLLDVESDTFNITQVCQEALDEKDSGNCVAFRNNYRWSQQFERFSVTELSMQTHLRQQGVYVITGGLGKIGLLLAKYIAITCQAHLILLTHNAFPLRTEWEQYLAEHDSKELTCQRIQQLLNIEKSASSIKIVEIEVEDKLKLKKLAKSLHLEYGNVHGVLHLAGNVSGDHICSIKETAREQVQAQFKAKISGVIAIDNAFSNMNLDFCILFSSLSSCLGGLGFASYAAANAYLDTYALYKNTQEQRWLTVNFDGWYFDVANKNHYVPENLSTLINYRKTDAAFIFELIFKLCDLQQVLISTTDLNARYKKWVTQTHVSAIIDTQHVDKARDILTKDTLEKNDYEVSMLNIWKSLLGINEIGMNDNFFELGGHSLSAIQLAARIRNEFNVDFQTTNIFDLPTIAEQAKIVESLSWAANTRKQLDTNTVTGEI